MKWKSWILAVAVFVGICCLMDAVFTHTIVLRDPMSDSERIAHLFDDNSDTIPIFGSSKAHGHYIPAEMGLSAYNYGMDAGSFEVTDTFLQIELAKNRTTPVIMELEYWDTEVIGDEGKFIPFVSDPRIHQLLEHYHAMKWRYYLPAIRYFGYYDEFLRNYFTEHMHQLKAADGFREDVPLPPFDPVKLGEFVRERRAAAKTGYYPNAENNRRLLAEITAHPQRLFFLIVSPYHPVFYEHFQNADELAAWEKQLAALPNVVVFDCGRSDYPDELFLDTLHLRRAGSAEFSRKIGNKIRQALAERSRPSHQNLLNNKP
jgi:hypothetical protein